jgi:hypothetical protein
VACDVRRPKGQMGLGLASLIRHQRDPAGTVMRTRDAHAGRRGAWSPRPWPVRQRGHRQRLAGSVRQGGRVSTERLQGGHRPEGVPAGSPRWVVTVEAEGVGWWRRSVALRELWWLPTVPEGSCSTGGCREVRRHGRLMTGSSGGWSTPRGNEAAVAALNSSPTGVLRWSGWDKRQKGM